MAEVKTFKDLGICDELIEACDKLGWKTPSKIQAEAIPHALDGLFFNSVLMLFYFCFSCESLLNTVDDIILLIFSL